MSLELRRPQAPPELEPEVGFDAFPEEGQPQPTDSSNVLVTSGIHRGRFPIGGLTVRRAREVLQRLITIDEEAVAVVNGRAVEEGEIISENVTHVAFVKPSSIKGAA